MAQTMIFFVLLGIVLLLLTWLLRRQARRQIGDSLSGRILYTDTETNPDILSSDRYNLSRKPDYILEEHGELIPVERKSRAVNSRGAHDSERLQLAAYCLLVEERYGAPVRRGRLQYENGSLDVAFDAALRAALLATLDTLQHRRMLQNVPRSHQNPARGCGFREHWILLPKGYRRHSWKGLERMTDHDPKPTSSKDKPRSHVRKKRTFVSGRPVGQDGVPAQPGIDRLNI
jgi:CRISPR-associated exonuclease Cas4